MQGVGARLARGRHDRRNVQVGGGAAAGQGDAAIHAREVRGAGIVFRVDADGFETHIMRGARDPDGDFAAVGDQDSLQCGASTGSALS